MRRFVALRSADGGTSLAEFALVTPLLFLVLIGVIEMGRWATFNVTVANAARAGAGYGAQQHWTPTDVSGIESAVCTDAHNANCPTPAPSAQNALTVAAPFTDASGNPQFWYCTNAASVGATPDPNAAPDTTCTPPAPDVQQNMWVKVTVSGTFTPLFSFRSARPQSCRSDNEAVQERRRRKHGRDGDRDVAGPRRSVRDH